MSLSKVDTLVHILRERADSVPSETAFSFLGDEYSEQIGWTCGELDRRARAIASRLQECARPGDRAVLIYPAGLEFIAAFFACLYAGVVAVPAVPPRNRRTAPRLDAILSDSDARICLTDSGILDRTRELVDSAVPPSRRDWFATNEIASGTAEHWSMPEVSRSSLAFVQYTSGSTSQPRGVMVSHENLIRNLSFLSDGRGHTGIVSWLPLFHDAGLIYAVLQSLYAAVPCLLMSPASFLQRPLRWLDALSKSRYSTSVAPNFAYELCIEKISDSDKKDLDLSNWTMALNGAEPVRPGTLKRFAAAFAGCGFRSESLKPAYGLAEATLGVAISKDPQGYRVKTIERRALAENRVVEVPEGNGRSVQVPGCGTGASDHAIAIVDPESRTRCAPLEIGEIWFAGPSVACGYWERPEESAQTFQARTLDSDEGPFLRTGDLGFVDGEEVYITGRLKDVIIIRGGNYYPQDVEQTVQESDAALQRDAGAAFAVTIEGEDRLVLVQELIRHAKADLDDVIARIRETVAEVHGLQVFTVLLVRPNAVPKTSSGKIRRGKTRELFLGKQLEIVAAWSLQGGSKSSDTDSGPASSISVHPVRGGECIQEWLAIRLAETLKMRPGEIEWNVPLTRYGLDSLSAVSFAGQLQEKLGRPLSASLLFDYPTLDLLSEHLNPADAPARKPSRNSEIASNEPVALIGFACRFPQAASPEAFWRLLRNGVDAISEVPSERWDADALYHPIAGTPGKMNSKWGGFLRDVDLFASEFFEISPREAAQIDPQQRLLLEVAWEALENSGLPPSHFGGSRTGVFVGMSGFDFAAHQYKDPLMMGAYAGTGLAHSIAANRISYFFDFRGPSVVVDTACSSSLVAIHQACESVRRGESDMALAGGVNLVLSPEMTITLSHSRMMASDGRCKTFDSRADGYVRGEGCAVAVLKRLADARRDGDEILALIHGSAVNQDGKSNGLTAPNGPAQEAVIREALQRAGVRPEEISYVECHGTGTALGDPQEIHALHNVLNSSGTRTEKCWVGSVKTNIGHLEAAAGIAGLLKVVMSLQNRQIAPNLHFRELNPHIRMDRTLFDVPTQLVDWRAEEALRAGVSSFGFGGTNCHVIVGEAPAKESPVQVAEPSLHLLTLSAKSHLELSNLAQAMASHLALQPDSSLGDICFTANTCRETFDCRLALVAGSCSECAVRLEEYVKGGKPSDLFCDGRGGAQRTKVGSSFSDPESERTGLSPDTPVSVDSVGLEPDDRLGMLRRLARIYCGGGRIDWAAFESGVKRTVVRLPNYPFQRSRFVMVARQSPGRCSFDREDPSWNEIVNKGIACCGQSSSLSGFKLERARYEALNELSVAYILRAFEQLGIPRAGFREAEVSEALKQNHVPDYHLSLLRSWVKAVERWTSNQLPGRSGDSEVPVLQDLISKVETEFTDEPFVFRLVDTCGKSLADAVLGRVEPISLLFPNGSTSTVEQLYRDGAAARYFNGILGGLAAALAQNFGDHQKLRILEIGGGTGGATLSVLKELPPQSTLYLFTDVGTQFIRQAKRRFQEYPFVQAAILDVDQEFEVQGIPNGSCDIVIASNILHATRDLDKAVTHVRNALRPGGYLLMLETTESHPWLEITFGLLPGWHIRDDLETRSASPLLATDQWNEKLLQNGFDRVQTFPASGESRLGQCVFFAQAGLSSSAPGSLGLASAGVLPSVQSRSSSADFFQMQWKQAEHNGCGSEPPVSKETETWILFCDKRGLCDRFVEALKGRDLQFVWVRASATYKESDKFFYGIRPGSPQDMKRLFARIRDWCGQNPIRRIVHFWSADSRFADRRSVGVFRDAMGLGCETITCVLRELENRRLIAKNQNVLWVVTCGVHLVGDAPKWTPEILQSPLWGLANVIALEHPRVWGGIIDVQADWTIGDSERLAKLIGNGSSLGQRAIRDASLFVPEWVESSLPDKATPVSFDAEGAYVITGGLGGIGLRVSRWMVEKGARHIVLMGRSRMPRRANWSEEIRSGGAFASRLSTIVEMEKLGAAVHLARVDVSVERQVSVFFESFQNEARPPIRGIIHAAGVLHDSPVSGLNRAKFQTVTKPKIDGAWNLFNATVGLDLEFFVLFSSVASVYGSPGQANHAAANAFLDVFGSYLRANSVPAQVLNWGPWSEVGAAARVQSATKTAVKGFDYLSPEAGLNALEIAMAQETQQLIIVARSRIGSVSVGIQALANQGDDEVKGGEGAEGERSKPERNNEERKNQEQVEARLVQFSSVLLGIPADQCDRRRVLREVGFDSLMAVQIKNEIESEFGAVLRLDEIPAMTISELAQRVLKHLGNRY